MKKVTQENIIEMNYLVEQGIEPIEIGKKFGVSRQMVRYHTNKELRQRAINRNKAWFKKLPDERKKEIYRSRRDYIRVYMRDYYKRKKDGEKEKESLRL